MARVEQGDLAIELDGDGFLRRPECWCEALARQMAPAEGIEELTERHWAVIRYIRAFHAAYGVAPMIRKICRETGLSVRELYEMFPTGPARGACKLAGLPRPTGCV